MKPFAFFALLLLSANVLAQTPAEQIAKLQKDPNIIWIGEFYRDYEDLDNNYEGRNMDRFLPDTLPDGGILHGHQQKTSILKLERRTPATGEWEYYLWAQVVDLKTKIFADADLSKPILDKDRTMEAYYKLKPQNIYVYAYRLRQLVYYNAKENMYYNLPLSIAPLRCFWNEEGTKKIGLTPLFWLPVIAVSTPINPSKAPNMPFIKSVQMHFPFVHTKVLKETEKIADVNGIWCESMRKQKDKIFAVGLLRGDAEDNKALLPQDIQQILNDMDTIIAYDPQTFEQIVTVNKKQYNLDISGLRINQTFGWDNKKQALMISTYSIAPIVNRYDDNRNLLNSGPLFYLYPHRRFKTVPK